MTTTETAPVTPATMDGHVTLPAAKFARWIKVVNLARCKDTNRPILCGIHADFDGGRLRLTTTDSYRIHSIDVPTTGDLEGPAKPFRALLPGDVLERWSKQTFRTTTVRDTSVSRWATKTVVPVVELVVRMGKMRLTVGDERFTTKVVPGTFPETDKFQTPEGAPDGSAAFNPKYLADLFRAAHMFAEGDNPVKVHGIDPLKPCTFSVANRDGGKLSLVLMPVRCAP